MSNLPHKHATSAPGPCPVEKCLLHLAGSTTPSPSSQPGVEEPGQCLLQLAAGLLSEVLYVRYGPKFEHLQFFKNSYIEKQDFAQHLIILI